MRLRGHHFFCSALFSGHGYDEAFTERMTAAIAEARAGEPLIPQAGPDDLCAACPHRLPEGGCALGTEDVLRRDLAAFAVLGLAPGQPVDWAGTRPSLAAVTPEGFQRVCGGCRWRREGLCSLGLLRQRAMDDLAEKTK